MAFLALASDILHGKREEWVRWLVALRVVARDDGQHGEVLLGEGGGGVRRTQLQTGVAFVPVAQRYSQGSESKLG
jgi:hypothetical protein